MPVKLPEDVFCASARHVIRARPTTGSGRGKRDLTLFVGQNSQLQQIAKLLNGETGVTHDAAERKGVDGVISWDRQDTGAI